MPKTQPLPSAVESEQALIGSCLLRPEIIPQVKEILSPLDFYSDAHLIIYGALCELGKQSEPSSIAAYLQSAGLLQRAGGTEAVLNLFEAVSTSAGWKYHAEIIRDRSERRALIAACYKAIDGAHDLATDYIETVSSHKNQIREIQPEDRTDKETNQALCQQILKDIEHRIDKKDPYSGIKTGLSVIDEKTWGLEPGTTIYLIARPSIGKTALALNIAEYVSRTAPGLALYFSLESSGKYLMRRLVAAYSTVYLTRIRKAEIDDSQWPMLMEAFNDLSANKNLRIISHPRYKNVERLISKVESISLERPLSLVVIDHIQRMSTSARKNNRHLELSFVSEQLSALSQNLNIPILVLSQIRRGAQDAKDHKPQLSELKESGDLEQNADLVLGLYRKNREAEETELECLKGRDTGTWNVKLRFDRFIQRFYNGEDTGEEESKSHWQDKERGFNG